MRLPPWHNWRPHPRQLLAGLTLLAYGATVFGLPFTSLPPRVGATPLACQLHHCDCQTAAGCQIACCCSPVGQQPSLTPSTANCCHDRLAPPPLRSARLSAPKCQGSSTYWVFAGAVLPVPAAPTYNPLDAASEWVRPFDLLAEPLPPLIPDPPPKA